MRKLKLIWDFRGPVSSKTAEHHIIHLREYASEKAINHHGIGIETINEMHSFAYMIVEEENMPPIRDALKPHRGQLAS